VGNPQPKAEEIQVAWLAGFWDGEGTLSLQLRTKHPRSKQGLISPYAQLSNTSVEALDHVHEILTAFQIGHHIQWPKLRPTVFAQSRRPQWRLNLFGYKRCLALLDLIEPYLIVKREQAMILREFIELRASKLPSEPYDDREWDCLTRTRRVSMKQGPLVA
jgi:hypothetical protein